MLRSLRWFKHSSNSALDWTSVYMLLCSLRWDSAPGCWRTQMLWKILQIHALWQHLQQVICLFKNTHIKVIIDKCFYSWKIELDGFECNMPLPCCSLRWWFMYFYRKGFSYLVYSLWSKSLWVSLKTHFNIFKNNPANLFIHPLQPKFNGPVWNK